MKLTIRRKGLIIIAVPLVFQFVFVGFLLVALDRAEKETLKEIHARQVSATADRLMAHSYEAAASLYKWAFARDTGSERQFDGKIEELRQDLGFLKTMVQRDPKLATASFTLLLEQIERGAEQLVRRKAAIQEGRLVPTAVDRMRSFQLINGIVNTSRDLSADMDRMTVKGTVAKGSDEVRLFIYLGVLASVLLTLAIAIFFLRNIEDRLDRIVKNLDRFSQKKELLPLQPVTDELGFVDKSFHEMAAGLRQAENLKHNFIGMISHDIRTPISAIKGIMELLEQEKLDEETGQLVTDGVNESRRLMNLVNNLMDLSRIELGRFEITPRSVNLAAAANQAVSGLRLPAQQKRISITVCVDDTVVYADPERLAQVLINLLSNAIKYAPSNSTVVITAALVDGDAVEIQISDNATPIPENMRYKIFESYERLSKSQLSDEEQEGAGLGLAICRSIVEAHGGSIGVKENADGGNVFWFRLPAKRETASAHSTQEALS